jgi:hypothetical protein
MGHPTNLTGVQIPITKEEIPISRTRIQMTQVGIQIMGMENIQEGTLRAQIDNQPTLMGVIRVEIPASLEDSLTIRTGTIQEEEGEGTPGIRMIHTLHSQATQIQTNQVDKQATLIGKTSQRCCQIQGLLES